MKPPATSTSSQSTRQTIRATFSSPEFAAFVHRVDTSRDMTKEEINELLAILQRDRDRPGRWVN